MVRTVLTLSALVLLISLSTSNAETWYILPDGTGDAPTIQAGVDSAAVGDTVMLANGTYTGDGNRDVDYSGKGIVIRSQDDNPDSCVIDCQGSEADPHRAFNIPPMFPDTAMLQGVTVTNGYNVEGAAIHVNMAYFAANNCVFRGNDGDSWEGVIYNFGSAILNGCKFTGNSTVALVFYGSGAVTDCLFDGNDGSVLYAEFTGVDFTDCVISGNQSGLSYDHGSGTITGCTFTDNVGTTISGFWTGFTIGDCTFARNGNGINLFHCSASVTNCAFTDNSRTTGGGAAVSSCDGSSATFADCTFARNSAPRGGALGSYYDDQIVLTNCVFWGNSATEGGAIYCEDAEGQNMLVLLNCTVAYNSATAGAGIYLTKETNPATATINHTIIAFNQQGGAVHCDSTSTADLRCSNVYGNAGGNWDGCLAGQLGFPKGNISINPFFCDETTGDLTVRSDSPCLPYSQHNLCGSLIGALGQGCDLVTGIPNAPSTPNANVRSYPNPFNPQTTIVYSVPTPGFVTISIYDAQGRHVRDLVSKETAPGDHIAMWDGRNDDRAQVTSGVYFVRMTVGNQTASDKLVLLK